MFAAQIAHLVRSQVAAAELVVDDPVDCRITVGKLDLDRVVGDIMLAAQSVTLVPVQQSPVPPPKHQRIAAGHRCRQVF